MICKNCGNTSPDGSPFCQYCGARLDPADGAAPVAGSAPVVDYRPAPDNAWELGGAAPAAPDYGGGAAPAAPDYGGGAAPAAPDYGGGTPYYGAGSADYPEMTTAPKKSKKKLITWLIVGAAALALVLVFVFCLLPALLGANGPIAKCGSALENTLKAGCTIEADINGRSTEDMDVAISVKADFGKRQAIFVAENDDNLAALYDGYVVEKSQSYNGREYIYKYDVSEVLDYFFDAYNKKNSIRDLDLEEYFNEIDPSGDLYEEFCEHVDEDAFKSCLQKYINKLNDQKWLEENAGLSVKNSNGKTTYKFTFKAKTIKKFAKASLEIFKPAFLDEDEYEDALDELNEDFDFDGSIELSFVIKGNKMIEIEFEYDIGYNRGNYSIEFKDIGSTEFDTDELEDLLDEADDRGSIDLPEIF